MRGSVVRLSLILLGVFAVLTLSGHLRSGRAKGGGEHQDHGAKMAPVSFSHEKHAKVDCAKCHHVKDKPTAAVTAARPEGSEEQCAKIQDAFHKAVWIATRRRTDPRSVMTAQK